MILSLYGFPDRSRLRCSVAREVAERPENLGKPQQTGRLQ